ncbi:MAG: outer membrane lipid asymmetry maintenance protein MlaD [Alphaproteobacteria bacterium]|nr:outer membrane lipid asymmetry maintenance protein MlaD [Alphaproteobacteria bacterium]
MEKGRVFETVVGVLVLIVAASFFYFVYAKSSWKSVDGYELVAKFDKVDGLVEGSDVKISGIRVGKVDSLEVDPQTFFAIVKFHVFQNVKVPLDSSASVSTDGLFGSKYLSLSPGGSDEMLSNGGEIEFTTGSVDLSALISKFVLSDNKNKKHEKKNEVL